MSQYDESDSPKTWWGQLEAWVRWRQFRKTWRVVGQGSRLHEQTHAQLVHNGLLGPWSFNYYVLMLCFFPATALSVILHVGLDTHDQLEFAHKAANDLLEVVAPPLLALSLPLQVATVAEIASRISLIEDDRTIAGLLRARCAFLYVSARRGWFWQALLVNGLAVLVLIWMRCLQSNTAPWAPAVIWTGWAATVLGGSGLLHFWLLPLSTALQQINGYRRNPNRAASKQHRDALRAYRWAMGILSPLAIGLILCLTVAAIVVITFAVTFALQAIGVQSVYDRK